MLQVCDLCCNAIIKRNFKKLYMQWRVDVLRKQRAIAAENLEHTLENGAKPPPVKFSLPRDRQAIVHMVQKVFKEFNEQELQTALDQRVIHKTFHSAGQDPEPTMILRNIWIH